MNIEKAIYLNTLTAAEETERKGRVVSAYTAGRIHGGVRFVMRGRGKARLIAAYRALTEQTSLSLDGKPIAVTLRPYTEVELCLDKGEHFFSADSPASHGGLTLIVEGAGVKGDGPYLDRVGGAYSASECVVYLKRGDGRVEKWVYDGSSLSCSARTERYFDEAYLYDAVGNTYLSTKRFCYAGTQNFTVNNGVSTVFSHDGVRSLAMCDGRSLSGADYLVAFVDKNGGLRFVRVRDGVNLTNADVSATVAGARRVVSAARGSIFLVEGADRNWTAYYFYPEGEKELSFTGYTARYDTIEIGRTGGAAPTATVDGAGEPVLYYRKEDGRLMVKGLDTAATLVAYAEAFHPAASGGLIAVEGELMPLDL